MAAIKGGKDDRVIALAFANMVSRKGGLSDTLFASRPKSFKLPGESGAREETTTAALDFNLPTRGGLLALS